MRRLAAITLVAAVGLGAGVANAGADTVKAKSFSFKPSKVKVKKGGKVTWKLSQGRHTVTFKNLNFDKKLNNNHPKRTLRFNKRGTYRYICKLHVAQGMKGKVVVK